MNETTVQDLISLKEQLLQKIASIDQILEFSNMNAGNLVKPIANNGHLVFKQTDSYKDKVAKVLKAENRFLNVNQITDIIHAQYPKLSKDDIKDAVGGAKSSLLKEGAIVKISIGASFQNSFYGSPNWVGSDGNPLKEYMYDEALIKEKKKIEI